MSSPQDGISADWISAFATAGATIVSFGAVWFAARSASASKASADLAARVLHRTTIRELVSQCHATIGEEQRIKSLVIDLGIEYNTLATFQNAHGGNRKSAIVGLLERDLASAAEKTKEAKSLVEDQSKLIAASDHDLDLMQGRIESARTDLQTVRESILRQLESLRIQVQSERERVKP